MPTTVMSCLHRLNNLLAREIGAWLILLVTVVLTLVAWRHAERDLYLRTQDRFVFRAIEEKNQLLERMLAYEQVLQGGAAFFAASTTVTRKDWQTYIGQLELDKTLPGVHGAGFALMIPAHARSAHEQAIRAEGFPDYAIHPAGNRDLYSSTLYIEPFSGSNLRAFGYDMYSDPVRREAMERARDSGQPALSGKVTLIQETGADPQPGFLIYLPVYRNGSRHATPAQRRSALTGFVFSPFRAQDLMQAVFKLAHKDVGIELFDGEPHAENLLYSSRPREHAPRHVHDMQLQIGGRTWSARFHSSPSFEQSVGSNQPETVLFGGLALDLLLFSVLYVNARHRQNMRRAAEELEQSRDRFRTLVENVPGTVFRSMVGSGQMLHISCGIEALTGEPPERYRCGRLRYTDLIHPDDRSLVDEAVKAAIASHSPYNVEYRIQPGDGRVRWVSERGRASYDEAGRPLWLDGVILDVTDRKVAEAAIRDMAFYDALTGLPNRRLLLDRLDQQIVISARTGRYCGLLFIDLDNFKAINDALGHQAGDQLLIEVANRLRTIIRASDTVARLGGDEFVVMLEEVGNTPREARAAVQQVGEKILEELEPPYRLGEHSGTSTPSIGATIFCGFEASVDELIQRADQAMYRAKAGGRNRLVFHD